MKTKQFEAGRNKLCVEMLRGHYAESAFPVLRSIPNKPLTCMPTLQTLASWTIMWCLEQNLVPYKTSRGAKNAL